MAGFGLAAASYRSGWLWLVLPGLLLGLGAVIASACVANNILDRGLDAHMMRTKRRPLVTQSISVRAAAVMAVGLGLLGPAVLWLTTGLVPTILAASGWIAYVIVYGIAKRRTPWGTLIGSISGAIPPVVGYTAGGGGLDGGALALFAIMVCWQMPHFYAIALAQQADYAAAGLPVLPVVRGEAVARRRMVLYIVAYIPATLSLSVLGLTGLVYAAGSVALGAWWLVSAWPGLTRPDDAWPRRLYRRSLVVIAGQSLLIAVGGWLP